MAKLFLYVCAEEKWYMTDRLRLTDSKRGEDEDEYGQLSLKSMLHL